MLNLIPVLLKIEVIIYQPPSIPHPFLFPPHAVAQLACFVSFDAHDDPVSTNEGEQNVGRTMCTQIPVTKPRSRMNNTVRYKYDIINIKIYKLIVHLPHGRANQVQTCPIQKLMSTNCNNEFVNAT